jgi:hypothetical protein
MQSYPSTISRCQHIKVNGTQCGSPALRTRKFCFFHQQWRGKRVRINPNAARRPASITLPVLEDANSIQVAVMQVTRLLLSGQIEHKTAGLTLYALQIASSNLARTSFEASRPTKVVVDRASVAETPLGATPWSATGQGHDPENDEAARDSESDVRNILEKLGLYEKDPDAEQDAGNNDENDDEDEGDSDSLPPGTIQACRRLQYVV